MPNPLTFHIEPLLPTVLSAVDSATVSLKFTLSASEVYSGGTVYTDSGTETLKFTVSGSEVYTSPVVYTDTGSVYLDILPANVALPIDFGTVYLTLNYYGNVIPPQYDVAATVDSGAVYLNLDFASDDCFAILTPHWHCEVVKRWNIEDVSNRWSVVKVDNRWDVWVIGVAIDNPCPIPAFEAIG